MSKIIGLYTLAGSNGEHLSLTMHPDAFPIRWSICGSTANFAAEYFADHIVGAGGATSRRAEVVNNISYVVNELIENAVKFNEGGDIGVSFEFEQRELVCVVYNQISAAATPALRAKLEALADGDPGELMLQQVEANAEAGDSGGSGLGFLLIMNDYGTSLGWKLEQLTATKYRLSTMARIPV